MTNKDLQAIRERAEQVIQAGYRDHDTRLIAEGIPALLDETE